MGGGGGFGFARQARVRAKVVHAFVLRIITRKWIHIMMIRKHQHPFHGHYDYEPPVVLAGGARTIVWGCTTYLYDLRPTPYALRPTPYDLRPTTYDLRPTTYDLRPTTYDLRPTTYDLRLYLPSSGVDLVS
jgi:hypothetical protein